MARQAAKLYIYRNLGHQRPERYSIRYKGRVIAHTNTAWLARGEFHVSERGNARVRREGKKYVHAFIVAEPCDLTWPYPATDLNGPEVWSRIPEWHKVEYNPYAHKSFMLRETGQPIKAGTGIALNSHGVYVIAAE